MTRYVLHGLHRHRRGPPPAPAYSPSIGGVHALQPYPARRRTVERGMMSIPTWIGADSMSAGSSCRCGRLRRLAGALVHAHQKHGEALFTVPGRLIMLSPSRACPPPGFVVSFRESPPGRTRTTSARRPRRARHLVSRVVVVPWSAHERFFSPGSQGPSFPAAWNDNHPDPIVYAPFRRRAGGRRGAAGRRYVPAGRAPGDWVPAARVDRPVHRSRPGNPEGV